MIHFQPLIVGPWQPIATTKRFDSKIIEFETGPTDSGLSNFKLGPTTKELERQLVEVVGFGIVIAGFVGWRFAIVVGLIGIGIEELGVGLELGWLGLIEIEPKRVEI